MKGIRSLLALFAIVLSACGDGSVQSPDFTAELIGLQARTSTGDNTASAAAGRTVQLEAIGTFTTPPGSEAGSEFAPVSAQWSSSDDNVATVDGNGLVTASTPGIATITATSGGFSDTVSITVTAAVLESLTITLEGDATQTPITSDQIASGTSRRYRAVGVYSDEVRRSLPVDWSSSDPQTATTTTPVDPTPVKTITVPITATVGDTADITVTSPADDAITATMTITVVGAQLQSVEEVVLDPGSPIPVDSSTEATAIGAYSDGEERQIADELLDWSSTAPAVATVDASGRVSTLAQGSTDILATLKPGAEPQVSGDARSASTPLTVTDAVCTGPLRASAGAVASSEVTLSCLFCSVSDEGNTIDADETSFATMSNTLGLLGGGTSITVTSPVTIAGGSNAGFIISNASGALNTELAAQLTVTTLLDGTVQDETTLSNPPVLVLLGIPLTTADPLEQALVSVPTSKPFNALRIRYGTGVAIIAGELQVYDSCGTASLPVP